MAIDFPSNPTNGQVYANYIYDSSITAWRNVNTDTGIGTLNAMGLKNVVPTSVSIGSGSATVNSMGTVSFTNITSNLILEGVFSSTYRNYRIVVTGQRTGGAASTMSIRFRQGSSDSTTNYATGYTGFYLSGTTPLATSMGSTIQDLAPLYYNKFSASVDIMNPNEATGTKINGTAYGSLAANGVYTIIGGEHDSTVQFTGLSLILGSSAATGTINIYGYSN